MSKCKVTFKGPKARSMVARSLRSPRFAHRVVEGKQHTYRDTQAMRDCLDAITAAFPLRRGHYDRRDDE